MRFVIVGNGKMAIDVLGVLTAAQGSEVVLCLGDPAFETAQSQLAKACSERGIAYRIVRSVNSSEALAALAAAAPDFIVSANNFLIFKPAAIAIPRLGIVNFHNGPLPRYGGLNVCSWALINGESEYGVTWHLVDAGIDSGPIQAQRRFPVARGETAIGLVSRCIEQGTALLVELLPRLIAGRLSPEPQSAESRLYYGRHDRPWHGDLPWWEPIATLERLSRALDFHPLPNAFYRPRIAVESSRPVWIEAFSVHPGGALAAPAGIILRADADGIEVAVPGGTITLLDPGNEAGIPHNPDGLAVQFGLGAGHRLARLEG